MVEESTTFRWTAIETELVIHEQDDVHISRGASDEGLGLGTFNIDL